MEPGGLLQLAAACAGPPRSYAHTPTCHLPSPLYTLHLQLPKPQTICDGLEARLGSLTWPIVRDCVDDVVTVSEEEVVAAMKLVFERMKV